MTPSHLQGFLLKSNSVLLVFLPQTSKVSSKLKVGKVLQLLFSDEGGPCVELTVKFSVNVKREKICPKNEQYIILVLTHESPSFSVRIVPLNLWLHIAT